MKWSLILMATCVLILIFLFEWPTLNKNKKNKKKEKFIFSFFVLAGWSLSLILSMFPNLSGPSQWVESVFRPLSKFLEK